MNNDDSSVKRRRTDGDLQAANAQVSAIVDSTYRVNGGVVMDPVTALTHSVEKGVSHEMNYIEIARPM
mgnify:CR=1 FL=1